MRGLLAIDAGNTRLKWGLHDGQQWARMGSIDTVSARGSAGSTSMLADLPCSQVIVSNVAGEEVAESIRAVFSRRSLSLEFVSSQPHQCGVINGYDLPTQLGCDRWAALIAAHGKHKQNQLIIMVGTALTIDALTAQGRFLGGVILPGPDLMRHSLNQHTAKLGMVDGRVMDFPTNTADAIYSGVVKAGVGAIVEMGKHLQAVVGAEPVCVMGGGASRVLALHLPYSVVIDKHLVLDGLLEIARH